MAAPATRTPAPRQRDGRRDGNRNDARQDTQPRHDPATLRMLLGDGVHELRAPKAGKYRTVSGYFDDLAALAAASESWSGKAPGIYVTINPVVPALLARCSNRAQAHAEQTTTDRDIERRRRLYIDCDPVRPSGIASTDAEHQAALDRVQAIARDLTALGWPTPIVMDSGNGAALFFAIDLPNDAASTALVTGVLSSLHTQYSDDVVKIDTTVSNAARIVRIPGTLNAKGDDTAERPHRVCKIIDAPEALAVVPRELLEALAGEAAGPDREQAKASNGTAYDIDLFIQKHGLEIRRDDPWQGAGRCIQLEKCPFNGDHVGGSAAFLVMASGALAFKCQHDSCTGRKWADVRDLLEPGRQRQSNGDARAETADATTEEWSTPLEWAQETTGPPLALEALPTIVRRYVEAVAESVQISPDFVATSALGVLAAAAGRRMEVAIGETHREQLNMYLFPVLGPGERKVAIRRVAAPLYEAEEELAKAGAPAAFLVAEQRAVAEARIQQLRKEAAKTDDPGLRDRKTDEAARVQEETPDALHPVRLAIDDATTEATARVLGEQGGVLSIVSEEAGSLFEVLAGKYSKGDAVSLDVHLKAYDGGEVRVHRIGRAPIIIPSACLSILATPQPSLLARIAEQRDFRGRGLLGRCCFVLPVSLVGSRKYQDRNVPEALAEGWRKLVVSIATRPIAPAGSVPAAPIAGEALDEWAQLADAIEAGQREGARLAGVRDWASKHAGRVARLAGLLHLVRHQGLEDPAEIMIDVEDVAAAGVIGEWLLEHALVAFGRLAATPGDDLARKLWKWIRRSREVEFTSRDAHRANQEASAEEIREALGVLADRGFIRRQPDEDRAGKPGRRPAATWDVNPLTLEATG